MILANKNYGTWKLVFHWQYFLNRFQLFFSCQVHNVESRWLRLLFKMADHSQTSPDAVPSQIRMTQIRDMLCKAARMRRTDSAGDLMPNVGCLHNLFISNFYILSTEHESFTKERINHPEILIMPTKLSDCRPIQKRWWNDSWYSPNTFKAFTWHYSVIEKRAVIENIYPNIFRT